MNLDRIKEILGRRIFISGLITLFLFLGIFLIVSETTFIEFFYVALGVFLIFILYLAGGYYLARHTFYHNLEIGEAISLNRSLHPYNIKRAYVELKEAPLHFSILSFTFWTVMGLIILFLVYINGVISFARFLLIFFTYSITILVSHLFQWYLIKNSIIQPLKFIGEYLAVRGEEETLQSGLFLSMRSKILLIFFSLLIFSGGIISLWGISRVNTVRRNIDLALMEEMVKSAYLTAVAKGGVNNPSGTTGQIAFLTEVDHRGNIISGEMLPEYLSRVIQKGLSHLTRDNIVPDENYLIVVSPPLQNGHRFVAWKEWNPLSSEVLDVIKDYFTLFLLMLVIVGVIIVLATNDWREITNALNVYLARVKRGNFSRGIVIYTDDELGDIGSYLNQVHDFFKNAIADARQLTMHTEKNIEKLLSNISSSGEIALNLKIIYSQLSKFLIQQKRLISALRDLTEYSGLNGMSPELLQSLTIATGKARGVISTVTSQSNFIRDKLVQHENYLEDIEKALRAFSSFTRRFRTRTDKLIETSQHTLGAVTSCETILKRITNYVSSNRIFNSKLEATRDSFTETMEFFRIRMGRLFLGLEELEKVLNLIYELSEDTKIISLNASIISSHAEEEGRSFSVVANQIQALASISGESIHTTKEILTRLTELKNNILEQTIEFLQKFQSTIQQEGDKSKEAELNELTESISETLKDIEEILKVTLETFRSIEEIDSFVESVENEIEQLSLLIKSYRMELDKISEILEAITSELTQADNITNFNIQKVELLNQNLTELQENSYAIETTLKSIDKLTEALEREVAEKEKETSQIKNNIEELMHITEILSNVNERMKRILIAGFKL